MLYGYIACGIAYFASIALALPHIKKLGQSGNFRIPFIPLPFFFKKLHGEDVYNEHKAIVHRLLWIKFIGTASILGAFTLLFWNRLNGGQ